jgi:hypothetical protein
MLLRRTIISHSSHPPAFEEMARDLARTQAAPGEFRGISPLIEAPAARDGMAGKPANIPNGMLVKYYYQ